LLASRRYNGSRSRKTKGSLADTLQCNIWRRAQTPHRMTHCLHGGESNGKPRPVVYVVPITSILGRLPLVPAGDHDTIPAAMRHHKKELFEYGKCDESARPGTGSKLYYINSWAMCWPTDHAKKPLAG